MATFEVTAPDGKKYEVTVPEGATENDAIRYIAETEYGREPQEKPITAGDVTKDLAAAGARGIAGVAALPGMIQSGQDVAADYLMGDTKPLIDTPDFLKEMTDEQRQSLEDPLGLKAKGKNLKKTLTKRYVEEGRSLPLDMANRAVEYGIGSLFTGAKAASQVPGLFNKAKQFIVGAKEDIGAGFGAASGHGLEALLNNGETSGWGELAGALAGIIRGGRAFKDLEPEQRDAALALIEQYAQGDPALFAKAKAAVEAGEIGTLADLADNETLFNAEAVLQRGSQQNRALNEKVRQREKQIAEEAVEPFGTGSKQDAARIAQEEIEKSKGAVKEYAERKATADLGRAEGSLAKTKAAADEQARIAAEQAEKAKTLEDTAAVDKTLADVSMEMKGRYGQLEKEIKTEKVTPAFDEFEAGSKIQIDEAYKELKKVGRSLPAPAQQAINNKYGEIISLINKWKSGKKAKLVEPADIQYVLSTMKDATNKAVKQGEYGTLEKYLNDLRETLQANLEKTPSAAGWANAMKESRELYKRVSPEKVATARTKEGAETFIEDLGLEGSKGQETARLVKQSEDEQLIKQLEDAIRTKVKREKIDDAFIQRHEGVLRNYPELRQELEQISQANIQSTAAADTAQQLQKQSEKAKSALEKTKETLPAETARRKKALTSTLTKRDMKSFADQPQKTIAEMMKGEKKGVERLSRLYNKMKAKGGEAGFKAEVKEYVKKIISPSPEGFATVKMEAIGDFEKMQGQLLDSGIITKAESDQITKTLQKTKSQLYRRESAAQKINTIESLTDNLVSSIIAAAATTAMTGTQTLMVGSAIKATIKQMMKDKKYGEAVLAKFENYIINPEAYIHAVTKSKTPQEAANKIIAKVVGTGQLGEQLTGEDE